MEHAFHFVGGLPRSASTLLCNILHQNPRFHATATSGCLEIMFTVRNVWNDFLEHKANPDRDDDRRRLNRTLEGIIRSYYGNVERPVVFDKSRGWPAYIEMLEAALGRKVKVLVPVRNLADVLASFEKLHRKAVARNAGGRPPGETAQNYYQMQTVIGRCEWWMREDQPVGLAYVRICDALARGLRDRLHFVVAEELTRRPAEVMQGVYDFLEEKPFMHNFEHVEQVTREDDGIHGREDLHTIRPKVEPLESNWRQVLGPIGEKWARAHQGLW
jgi:sulfotransferase